MITEVNRVFYVERHDGAVNYRRPAETNPIVIDSLLSVDALRNAHTARGIGSTDFGMFVDVMNDDGSNPDMESFLVTQTLGHNSGIIVPSDDVLENPREHFTKELARKIAVMSDTDLDDLSLLPLGEYVGKNYQEMRALR